MSDDPDEPDGAAGADGSDESDRTDDGSGGRRRGDGRHPADDGERSPVDGADGGEGDVATDVQDVDDLLSEFDEPDGDLEDLFDEVPPADVDAGAVWAQLEGSAHAGDVTEAVDTDRVEEPIDDAVLGEGPGDEAIVSKASYCQRCEHFSSPPDVGCGNPGTEIVELVDVKHFRVRNCPVVARRRGATVTSLDGDRGDVDGGDGTPGSGAGGDGGEEGGDGEADLDPDGPR